ncbi:MAG: ferrous iron transport protein A [Crenarchaeota archaeon]|nr:ferrous iron transport protein A [Thermoproteota archaeon]MCR8453979.1 ferrous iron transport protein A [Thermoproteota archaeon]MCR8455196.1 ferrous iron transport protein A [Thermoproteota archaeon]MCR8463298.1 ferrous iron transport protein A [Thermoproteota archaeon]MCR8471412.1 ferrous iron transport protein A [Thermoproteota archaeon]
MHRNLAEIDPKSWVEVVDIEGNVELMKRLAELGFVPGERVYVLINNRGSYIVVESYRGRFGFPKEVAEKILVREISTTSLSLSLNRIRHRHRRRRRSFWRL